MSGPEERHLHVDLAAWAEKYLADPEGRALRLTEFQQDILRRIASGERVMLYNARDAHGWLPLLAGVQIVESNPYQAVQIYEAATAMLRGAKHYRRDGCTEYSIGHETHAQAVFDRHERRRRAPLVRAEAALYRAAEWYVGLPFRVIDRLRGRA
jgi:hypothetical protein